MSRSTSFVCTLALVVLLASSSASAQTFTQLADYVVEPGWVAEGISGDVSTGILRRGDTIVRFDAISGVHRDTIVVTSLKDLVYVGRDLYAIITEVINKENYFRVVRFSADSTQYIKTEVTWPHVKYVGHGYDMLSPSFEKSTNTRLLYVRISHYIRTGGRPSNDGGYLELAVYDMTRQTKIDSMFPGNYKAYFSANGEEVCASESGYANLEEDVLVYATYENGVRSRRYHHNEKPYAVPVGTYNHIWHGTTLYAASSLKPILTQGTVRAAYQNLVGKGHMWVKTGGKDDTLYYYNIFTNHRVDIDTVPDSRNSSYRFLPFPDQQKFAVIYGGVRVTIHSWSDIHDNDITLLTTPNYRRYQYDMVSLRVITTLRIDTARYEWYIGDTLYATTSDPHVIVRPRTVGEYPVHVRIVSISGQLLAETQLDSTFTVEQKKGTTVIGHIDGWEPQGMEVTAEGTTLVLKTYGTEYEYTCDTASTPWIATPSRTMKEKYVSYRDRQSNIITGTNVGVVAAHLFRLVCHRRHPETSEIVDSTTLLDVDMGRGGLPYPIATERFTTLLIDQVYRDTLVIMHKRSFHENTWDWQKNVFHMSNEEGFLQEALRIVSFRSPGTLQPYDSHNGTLAIIELGKKITFLHLHRGGNRPSITMSDVPFTAVHIVDSNTIVTNAGVFTWDTTWTKTDSLPYDDIIGFVRIPKSESYLILRSSTDTTCVYFSRDSINHSMFVGSTYGSIRTYYVDYDSKRIYVLDDHNVLHLWDLTGLPVYAVERPIETQDDSTDIGIVQRIECYDLMGRLLQRVNGSADNHSSCRGLPHIVIHHGEHGMRRTQVFIGE